MIGSRARIGIIYPEDGLLDSDFYCCSPFGVSVHITRVPIEQTVDQLRRIESISLGMEKAASLFNLIKPDCVAFACTAASFLLGAGRDYELSERIAKITGCNATTTATASVEALRSLAVKKISVLAPYEEETCSILSRFFEDSGFHVLNTEALGLNGMAIPEVDPYRIYHFAKTACRSEADAIFISCTNFRGFEIISYLEKDLNKPVVTANQATMWHALRLAGVFDYQHGLGKLFNSEQRISIHKHVNILGI